MPNEVRYKCKDYSITSNYLNQDNIIFSILQLYRYYYYNINMLSKSLIYTTSSLLKRTLPSALFSSSVWKDVV